jgi:hypothetical protein
MPTKSVPVKRSTVTPPRSVRPPANAAAVVAPSARGASGASGPAGKAGAKPEPKILFQKFFKSVGPRTYAAQVKEAGNGNHFLVLTEGKRDENAPEVRKTRLFVFGEDFTEFFRMLHETAQFIKANPVPDEVRARRKRFWAKQNAPAQPAASAR